MSQDLPPFLRSATLRVPLAVAVCILILVNQRIPYAVDNWSGSAAAPHLLTDKAQLFGRYPNTDKCHWASNQYSPACTGHERCVTNE